MSRYWFQERLAKRDRKNRKFRKRDYFYRGVLILTIGLFVFVIFPQENFALKIDIDEPLFEEKPWYAKSPRQMLDEWLNPVDNHVRSPGERHMLHRAVEKAKKIKETTKK